MNHWPRGRARLARRPVRWPVAVHPWASGGTRALHHGPLVYATACLGIVCLSSDLHAQEPAVAECNLSVGITIQSSSFDSPVQGPLTYEWRDELGQVVGLEAALVVALPVGQYTRTLTVTAPGGRSAEDGVTLAVRDTFPPTIQTRLLIFLDQSVAARTGADLISEMDITATDLCDPNPTISAEPAGPYEAGATQVVLTATDIAGNSESITVRVVVAANASGSPATPSGLSASDAPGAPAAPVMLGGPGALDAPGASASGTSTAGAVVSVGPAVSGRVPPGSQRPPSVTGAGQVTTTFPSSEPVLSAGRGYLWWVAGLGALTLAGLFVFALTRRSSSSESETVPGPVFQAIARSSADAQHRILPDGPQLRRYTIWLRPTADPGTHTIEEAVSRTLGERRPHD